MNLHPDLEIVIQHCLSYAFKNKFEYISIEQLLLAITNDKAGRECLMACGADLKRLQKNLKNFIEQNTPSIAKPESTWAPQLSLGFQRLLQRAWHSVQSSGKQQIYSHDLIVAIYSESDCHARDFLENEEGISRLDLLDYISHGLKKSESLHSEIKAEFSEQNELASYVRILSKDKDLQTFLFGRDESLQRIYQILARKDKANILLVGESGVGKSAIAYHLASLIRLKKVPLHLQSYEMVAVDLAGLMAGSKFRGELEERFQSMIISLKKKFKKVIIFFDDLPASNANPNSQNPAQEIFSLLKWAILQHNIACIATLSYRDLKSLGDRDKGFMRLFQKIEISELSKSDSFEVLKTHREKYQSFHHVNYSDEILQNIIDLSSRYLSDKFFPDKALDLMDEVGAHISLRAKAQDGNQIAQEVLKKDVEDCLARMAGIPSQNIGKNERTKLQDLEKKLKEKIYGQDSAIEQVCLAVKSNFAGLTKERKPTGSFLFAGPTGVGKTELAKQLASELNMPFLRFDMSEYMEKHSVSRLVGAPPGYVGFDEGGLLTEAISKKPYSVLLFDEMEKAHPDVLNILLQFMDDASLTDTNGKKVDCQNVILIMTTNAGARDIAKAAIGIIKNNYNPFDLEQIKKTFSPEFLNRIDAVIGFNSLDEKNLMSVVSKFFDDLQEQLRLKNINLKVSDEVKKHILKLSYQPEYGARPIQRKINELIKQSLINELLFGSLQNGGSVTISLKNENLDFQFVKS